MIASRRLRSGQTLIIALLILGILLGLGFVFAGLISRNISQTGRSLERTRAGDLADAGVRFAHNQLLFSELGADWRPAPTPPSFDAAGISRDPDALYTRPGTGFGLRNDADPVIDRGGPDGLGPFSRVEFDRGRALVRVLYLPGDFSVYNTPSGVVRQPGKAKNYVRVEAVGRVGRINANDPTTLASAGYKVTNFVNSAEFRTSLASLKQIDTRQVDQKKLVGFVSLGLTEHARFITNKFNVGRAAEIGSPSAAAGGGTESDGLGITYEGQNITVPTVLGGTLYNATGNAIAQGTGSIYSNADLVVHGFVRSVLNPGLGDSIQVAGRIRPANPSSDLQIDRVNPNGSVTSIGITGNNLNSENSNFSTNQGLLRDGVADIDGNGYPRSVNRKEPPSFLGTDPSTGINRYQFITRDSGVLINGRNSGRFGHGKGIYVSASDRANASIESDREASDPSKSLVKDWLNPNNPDSAVWKGPYYIPIAAYLRLLPDGFEIIRDARSTSNFERTWRNPNGTDSGQSVIRYRVRTITLPNGERYPYILNSLANPTAFTGPSATLSDVTYLNSGQPFNGVLYFEGDVRVRGVIPTDQQITVCAQGSIYIEGSITKGVVREDGTLLNRPSRSMAMLMAKDYVVVNTTMFFGPTPGSNVVSKATDPLPNTQNPIELVNGANDRVTLSSEFLLNPVTAAGLPSGDPSSWEPFASTYQDAQGTAISPNVLISHSADDNGPTFVNLNVQPRTFFDAGGTASAPFLFPRTATFNAAAGLNFPGTTGNIPVLGLAVPQISAYPRFETDAFSIAGGGFTVTNRKLVAPGANANGVFSLGLQDPTEFDLGIYGSLGLFASKNYALGRFAVNPHDIRIEAGLFAEEGSFFVIPGPAFNVNSEDTREVFNQNVASVGLSAAQQLRYDEFGSMPTAPFYGEPLNVRVNIIGSVTENMPAPISQQSEWQRRWGWMPRILPGTDLYAPAQHIPAGWGSIVGNNPAEYIVPNLTITYDPALAIGSADGANPIRTSPDGAWILPPMPRLPVSPKFAYFGENNP